MNLQKWRFPSNDYGEIHGINESGLATFRGEPLKSLAREICQNSLDAAIEDNAYVEFSLFAIPQKNVPGIEDLQYAFNRCREFTDNAEARDFFTNALNKSVEETCYIMRVSDYMTKGLTGAREKGKNNWSNLVKSSGVSDKKGAAGGSFGIGKYAPFTCSDYSCVFYSTYDMNEEVAYQGVARLASFNRDDDITTQGIGYYGYEKNTPIFEQLFLEPNYYRDKKDYGTDIYIISYKYVNTEWKKELVIAILENFLDSIYTGKLSVKIDDIYVNSDTLKDLIYKKYPDEMSKKNIDRYYEVYTSKETIWIKKEDFYTYGEIELGILINKNELPKKISMIRKTGMKIMDRRFQGYIHYIGVCRLLGEKLNTRLRAMENPEHTKWEPDRLKDPKKGRSLINTLNEFIKEELNKIANVGVDDAIDAVGVGEYIPDEVESNTDKKNREGLEDTIAQIDKQVIKKRVKTYNSFRDGNSNNGYHSVKGGEMTGFTNTGRNIENPDPNNLKTKRKLEDGNENGEKVIPIKMKKIQPICIDYKKGLYSFLLEAEQDVDDGIIDIKLSAENDNYPASIAQAVLIPQKELNIDGGRITGVVMRVGKKIQIKVELNYHDYCSLEVYCYEVEK